MPGLSGIEIQRSLASDACQLPVVFLTGHGDIPMSVQAMKAGAVDFLTKPVQRATLLAAVHNALQLDAEQRASKMRTAEVFDCYRSLTPREQSILKLVVAGKLNKQIATSLDISERTVKAHRAQVMSKMNVTSVADLVRAVSLLGLRITDE
jgi:FixJ family two-component response regulator